MINSNFNEIEFTLGGKIERFAAYVIDSLVALLAILPLGIPFLLAINDFSNGSMESINSISIESNRNFTLGVFLIIIQFFIQGYLITTRGQSIGKIIMSLRIVNAIDGTNPGFFKAFLVRFILTQIITSIPTIGALYFIIDPLFIFRNDRRCIHDLMAKTIVVDSKLHSVIKKEK